MLGGEEEEADVPLDSLLEPLPSYEELPPTEPGEPGEVGEGEELPTQVKRCTIVCTVQIRCMSVNNVSIKSY